MLCFPRLQLSILPHSYRHFLPISPRGCWQYCNSRKSSDVQLPQLLATNYVRNLVRSRSFLLPCFIEDDISSLRGHRQTQVPRSPFSSTPHCIPHPTTVGRNCEDCVKQWPFPGQTHSVPELRKLRSRTTYLASYNEKKERKRNVEHNSYEPLSSS